MRGHETKLFFHVTEEENAAAILKGGFKDSESCYLTRRRHKGVFITDDYETCFQGDLNKPVVLQIELSLDAKCLADYEWVEKDKTYREWCIPSSVLNKHATVRVASL